ncbi:zinc-ribbon domain-containing protein [Salipiger pallidus]|nr:zinc-ribbon domain-containing protein [Salipiger pallidus]
MRLICPNCGAQYEVPTNVIPEGGRDVQCSNCGHTWFQAHPDDDLKTAPAENQDRPTADLQEASDEAIAPPPPPSDPDGTSEDAFGDDDLSDPDDEDKAEPTREPVPVPEAPTKPRRELDPSVAEVLRAEAEREKRRREAESLESQPDLGLQEPSEDKVARRSREARDRMAHIQGTEPDTPAPHVPVVKAPPGNADASRQDGVAAAAVAGSRREMLPDIEEINQTLRASSERHGMETPQGRMVEDEEDEAERSGFAAGFRLVIAIMVLAVLVYIMADKVVTVFPESAEIMNAYTSWVDGLRLWLDSQVSALVQMIAGGSPTE